MSTSTETTVNVNPAVSPEQAALEVKAEAVAEAKKLAEERDAKRKASNETLMSCVVAYVRGESNLLAGRLESGRFAAQFVRERIAIGETRENATSIISAELLKHTGEKVNAANLIRVYHSHTLLAESAGEAGKYAGWTLWQEAFTHLVERTGKASSDEAWQLLPGYSDSCKAVFKECCENKLSNVACKAKVSELVKAFIRTQAEVARKAAEATEESADKAKEVFGKLSDTTAQLKEAADKAKEALKTATDANKEALKAAADKAVKEHKEAKALAEIAAKESSAADKAAKRADESAKSLEEQVEKADSSGKRTTPAPASTDNGKMPEHNPLAAAKIANPKDLAESLAAQIAANRSPAVVIQELMGRIEWSAVTGEAIANGIIGGACRKDIAIVCGILQKHLAKSNPLKNAPLPAPNGQLVAVPA